MDLIRLDIGKTEEEAPGEDQIRLQVALLAALAATAAGLAARFAFNAPLLPELMSHFLFSVVPIGVVEFAVGLLGPFAKHLGFLGCVVLYAAALAGAATGFLRYLTANILSQTRWVPLIGFSLAMWLATVGLAVPLLGGGFFGRRLEGGATATLLWSLLTYAVYGAAVGLVPALYRERPKALRTGSFYLTRRRVVRGVWFAVIAVAVYDIGRGLLKSVLTGGSGRVREGSGVFPDLKGLAQEVTPTSEFYQVSKNPFDPQVSSTDWSLEVGGLVENAVRLGYEQLRGMTAIDQYATLACISNEVGGNLIGNALWKGVRLRDVMGMAGLKRGVVDIVFWAADGYSDSIPVERAMADGTLLVYEMNGGPLTPAHGFPARLIVPGIYGMKNVKWVTRIEAVDYDFKGYWQKRGWDDRAEYKTMSRIDTPDEDVKGTATIAGIAFAGDRGIGKVEVSADGGQTWEDASLKPALSPFAWILWHLKWTPGARGRHSLVARATDGFGVTQTARRTPPAPDGSSGYPTRQVDSSD